MTSEFGPLGLAVFAAIVTALSLRQQRAESEERVYRFEERIMRERGLTWQRPDSKTAPKSQPGPVAVAPDPDAAFAERLRRAWQNELITYEEYLLAQRTGVHVDDHAGAERIRDGIADKLMEELTSEKTHKSAIEGLLRLRNGLTRVALRIKRLGQMSGATIEVAVAERAGEKFLVVGLNSSARWTSEQLAEITRLRVERAPQRKGLDRNQPHAEENILWFLDDEQARLVKISNAPVGAGKSDSDVCRVCRAKVRQSGGEIEPGMHGRADASRGGRRSDPPAGR